MATRSPTRRLGSACSSRQWRGARGRAGARSRAGARDGPAQTTLTTLRRIGPSEGLATSRRTGRRTRRPSGRAAKVPPATHRPCTHCALSVHHRHAPAVHRPCTHLSRLTVLRRPTPATPCLVPPTSYAYARRTRATAAGHRAACHAREPRRTTAPAGRRSEAPAESSRAESRPLTASRVSCADGDAGDAHTDSHDSPHVRERVTELRGQSQYSIHTDPREDATARRERLFLWLVLNC